MFLQRFKSAIDECSEAARLSENKIVRNGKPASNLVAAMETIFLHGLKLKYYQMFTEIFTNDTQKDRCYCIIWNLLKHHLTSNLIQSIQNLDLTRSHAGRCRVWIRMAICEGSLESYIRSICSDRLVLMQHYQKNAILLNKADTVFILNSLKANDDIQFELDCRELQSGSAESLHNGSTSGEVPKPSVDVSCTTASPKHDDLTTTDATLDQPLVATLSSTQNFLPITMVNIEQADETSEAQVNVLFESEIKNWMETYGESSENDDLPETDHPEMELPSTTSIHDEGESIEQVKAQSQPVPLPVQHYDASIYQPDSSEVMVPDKETKNFMIQSYDSVWTEMLPLFQNVHRGYSLSELNCRSSASKSSAALQSEEGAAPAATAATTTTSLSDDPIIEDALQNSNGASLLSTDVATNVIPSSTEEETCTFEIIGDDMLEMVEEVRSRLLNIYPGCSSFCVDDGRNSVFGGQCHFCGVDLTVGESSRLDYYDGLLYCSHCHHGSKCIIPREVFLNWNFEPMPVSAYSYAFLKKIDPHPNFNVLSGNPLLYRKISILNVTRMLRFQLLSLFTHISRCDEKVSLLLRSRVGHERFHMLTTMQEIHLYSLKDLCEVSSGELPQLLRLVLHDVAIPHVRTCKSCRQVRILCDICRSESDIVLLANIDSVQKCSSPFCINVVHNKCISVESDLEFLCSRCTRVRDDEDISLSIERNTDHLHFNYFP